ncbi:MAG: c-type cytochrome [Pseudohaliea sp.]
MVKSKLAIATLLAASAALTAPAALALDGEQLYKTKTCAACHGKDGDSPMMPIYPKIAGQNAAYAIQQMQDIKSGARANGNSAAMKGVMHLVSDEEIEAIAEWLATKD